MIFPGAGAATICDCGPVAVRYLAAANSRATTGSWVAHNASFGAQWDDEPLRPPARRPRFQSQATQSRTRTRTATRTKGWFMENPLSFFRMHWDL